MIHHENTGKRGVKDYQISTNKLTPEQTTTLTLYQYKASPFCVNIRRTMKYRSLNTGFTPISRTHQKG